MINLSKNGVANRFKKPQFSIGKEKSLMNLIQYLDGPSSGKPNACDKRVTKDQNKYRFYMMAYKIFVDLKDLNCY